VNNLVLAPVCSNHGEKAITLKVVLMFKSNQATTPSSANQERMVQNRRIEYGVKSHDEGIKSQNAKQKT